MDRRVAQSHFSSEQILRMQSDVWSGGAAGSAATRRKRKTRQGDGIPPNVLRTLIAGLKTCLNNGTSLQSVIGFLQNKSNQKPQKKKGPLKRIPLKRIPTKFNFGRVSLIPLIRMDGGLGLIYLGNPQMSFLVNNTPLKKKK
jgi:hypothetical protein